MIDKEKTFEVDPEDTVNERVVKATEYFKSKIESVSLGNVENLTVKEVQTVRDAAVYDAINFYMEDWEGETYDLKELGELVFLLRENLLSAYIGVVL